MGWLILSLAFFTPQLRPGSQGTKAGPRFWSQIPTFGGCGSFLFSAYCSKSEPGLNLTGLCSVPAAWLGSDRPSLGRSSLICGMGTCPVVMRTTQTAPGDQLPAVIRREYGKAGVPQARTGMLEGPLRPAS